jgi:O-antigen/teichoic acid export membrane protein
MIRKILEFFKDSAVYGVGQLINKVLQILLLPLIFIYLNKIQFGVLDYFLSLINILSVFFGLGIITGLQRFEFDRKSYNFNEVISSSFLILSCNLIFIIPLLYFRNSISIFLIGDDYSFDFTMVILISSISAFNSIPLGVLRVKRKPFLFLSVTLTNFIFYLSSTYFLISTTNLNYKSFLWGGIIGITLSFFVGLYHIREYLIIKIDFKLIKSMLRFSLAILLTSLTTILLSSSNRIFIKMASGFDELATLGMASRFSNIIGGLILAPFTLAWLPYLNSLVDHSRFQEIINKLFDYITVLFTFFILLISLFSIVIINLIGGSEYASSYYLIPAFSLNFLFLSYYYFFAGALYLRKQTSRYIIIAVIVTVFNTTLYLVLLNVMNIVTATIITSSSYVLLFLLAYHLSNRMFEVNVFKKNRILFYIAFILLILADQCISYYSNDESILLVSKLIITTSFISIVLLLRLITNKDLKILYKTMSNKIITNNI